jgi:hypothetical protein
MVLVCWSLTTHTPAHLVPHIPFMLIMFSTAIEKRRTLKTVFVILFFTNFYWLFNIFHVNYNGFKVMTGDWSHDEFLAREHINVYHNPPYGGYQFLNTFATDHNLRVLILGEERQYYCNLKTVSNTMFTIPEFFEQAQKPGQPANLAKWVTENKISFILVNKKELTRIVPCEYLSPANLKVIQNYLFKYTRPVYTDKTVVVYQVH